MATLFDKHDRVVPAWLAACQHLLGAEAYTAPNLVLEMHDPVSLTDKDREIIRTVDVALRSYADLSLETVAGTLFPQGLYLHYGRPAFYDKFMRIMKRAKKRGTWGTYAMRLISRGDGSNRINPLEITIGKLRRAANEGKGYASAYELGMVDPESDLAPDVDFGCELPTYDPLVDGRKVSNMPCLSHLSFKLVDRNRVDLSVMYRSHHYCARSLGNLIGLSRLQSFVAREAGLKTGVLTCLSTHATLDMKSWGGTAKAMKLLKDCSVA